MPSPSPDPAPGARSRGLEAKPIVGYSDPLVVAPGEPISFMVSTVHDTFEARVVRLRHGDRAPGGPGLRYEEIPSPVDRAYPGRDQPLSLGSCVAVPSAPELEPRQGLAVQAWIRPTAPERGLQGIVTKWDEKQSRGYGLFLERDGSVSLRIDAEVVSCSAALRPSEWAFVSATWDSATSTATVRQIPLSILPDDPAAEAISATVPVGPSASEGPVVIGGHAVEQEPRGAFNGKIDSPRLYARALTSPEVDHLIADGSPQAIPSLVAAWGFALDADDELIPDVSGRGHHGRAVNHPMRAVTGHDWTGAETAFFHCPEQYNAASFHDDDLEDAEWEPAFTFVPPHATRSGVYAAHISTDTSEDWIPFFIRPPRGRAHADLALLVPTVSYLAYANDHSAADVHGATTGFDISEHYQPEDHYAIDVPVKGLYDHHTDGTGVCYSSWRRPIVNMRPHYHLPVARAAHQLSADLHLVDWLEEKGIRYDVVTDHDLHHEGQALLSPYRAVMTGTHPEYWTGAMLDGLESYLDQGGRLVCLGGNGFYWVTSISPSRPHLIEVRRGRRGTGSWRSEPGEDYHSTTRELGGLWRDRGRAPQRLVGVGMAAQGFDQAISYRRSPASYAEDCAWIFEGVDEAEIGGGGLVLGGPAGFEIDRFDHRLGTPTNATLLATAQGFSDGYQHVVEEVTTSDSLQGGTVSPDVRADMVYFERRNGGAVFATGSIAWSGALSLDNYGSSVSRITENVIRRFTQTLDDVS